MAINLKALFDSLQKDYEKRYTQGLGYVQDAVNLFNPSFTSDANKTALSSMVQSTVGRGLGGSVVPGKVSVGMSRNIEDVRRTRLADALNSMGIYIQRGTPTAANLASLATGGFSDALAREQLLARLNAPRDIISGNMYGYGYQPFTDPFQQGLSGV